MSDDETDYEYSIPRDPRHCEKLPLRRLRNPSLNDTIPQTMELLDRIADSHTKGSQPLPRENTTTAAVFRVIDRLPKNWYGDEWSLQLSKCDQDGLEAGNERPIPTLDPARLGFYGVKPRVRLSTQS